MKKILFSLLLISHFSFGQNTLVEQWDHRYGGSGFENLFSIQKTADGGFILGGYSDSPVSGDKSEPGWGGDDYWIMKVNSNGFKQWNKRYGGTDHDEFTAVIQTKDGGYILGGYSRSDISGDKSQDAWDDNDPFYNAADYWIVKTDSQGNKLWDKRFGGSSEDQLSCILQTSDGGYIIGGSSKSDSSGDKTQQSWNVITFGWDYWIVRIDSVGNKLWDKRYGGSGQDYLFSMLKTNDGNYLLGGWSSSGAEGDKTEPDWGGGGDYWIVKIDTAGNKLWDKSFGGLDYDILYSMQQTMDGGFVLAGNSYSGIGGNKNSSSYGGLDYWLVKVDVEGNKEWDQDYGGDDDEEILGNVICTQDGGYLLSGASLSDSSGDKTENNPLFSKDTWIVKTDDQGNKQWDKTIFNNGWNETGFGIETGYGCYLFANSTDAEIGGYKTQHSRGLDDYWTVQFCDTSIATNASILHGNFIFSISPNPNTGNFTLDFSNSLINGVLNIEIVNALGEKIFSSLEKISSSTFKKEIDLSGVAHGVYLVEIKANDQVCMKKILITE